jgi:hypothetical protein
MTKNNKKGKFQSEAFEVKKLRKAFFELFHFKSFKNLSKPSKFKNESLNNEKKYQISFSNSKKPSTFMRLAQKSENDEKERKKSLLVQQQIGNAKKDGKHYY